MKSRGADLTPREIITLNAFAERIENSADTADTFSAPRVAWINDDPIYQPTIQSEIWYNTFARKWWEAESLNYALAWSCANARIAGFFEDKTDEKKTRKLIEKWYKIKAVTWDQINTSVAYVYGLELADYGETGKKKTDECPFQSLINNLISCSLGLSIADIKTLETDRAYDIINRWARNLIASSGGDASGVKEGFKKTAIARYYKYLYRVKKHHGIQ